MSLIMMRMIKMEIECINKCGNLTDSPNEKECETCREITIEEIQARHKEAMLKFQNKS